MNEERRTGFWLRATNGTYPWSFVVVNILNKGNNKITELQTILQREGQKYENRQNQSTTGKL